MQQTTVGVSLVGCGSARLSTTLSNDDLSHMVETSDEWIATRTGIRQRHLAAPQDSLSSLAASAGAAALDMGGVGPADVD